MDEGLDRLVCSNTCQRACYRSRSPAGVCVCVSVCLCVCVCLSVSLSLCLSVCVGEALLLAFLDIFEVSFQDAIVILVQKIETEALAAMQVRLKPLLPYSR